MRINFELLDVRAFLAVLDLGGFHKAAEALNLSQPTLSRRIQSLETAIGTSLLERTTRRVAPTASGRAFAPLARRLLDEFDETLLGMSGVGDRQAGQITVACIPTATSYFLPRAIERFNARFPHIRFHILDLKANEALDSVRHGEAEFGINVIGAAEPDLVFTAFMEEPFVLACRRDHRLARRRRIAWQDLAGETLIGVSRATGNRAILEGALAALDVRLRFQYEVSHLTTSLGLVERGLGISVIPKLGAPPRDHPTIVSRPIGDPAVTRTVGLLERRAARLSPAAQRFRDMLIESLPR
jgi:DNA-binding transcriptional LysR family regulator